MPLWAPSQSCVTPDFNWIQHVCDLLLWTKWQGYWFIGKVLAAWSSLNSKWSLHRYIQIIPSKRQIWLQINLVKRDTNNIHANTLDQDILPCCIHLTEGQWPFQSHWPCTTSITHDLYRLWINFITVKWYQTLQNKWFNVFPNFFRLNIFLFDSLGTNFWSPGHSTSCGCRLLLCSQLLSLKCPTLGLNVTRFFTK